MCLEDRSTTILPQKKCWENVSGVFTTSVFVTLYYYYWAILREVFTLVYICMSTR